MKKVTLNFAVCIMLFANCLLLLPLASFPQSAWTQKADFGGTARSEAVGFSIGSKGYIGTGCDEFSMNTKDFWEYDPLTNVWIQKANFGGQARMGAVGFSIPQSGKGYIGIGSYWNGTQYYYYNDFWEYDPSNNTWNQKTDFSGTARGCAVGFSVGEDRKSVV